ncbi:MutS-related protein [Dyadobacter sp. CY323]|uniref:MutS-related protein n=1 Tax=Dyadobacter sp. CY323 TaxID=2907302 RepID=UPI001F3AB6D1|nr:DNA mismatch repair protein MutS [Dyadobacter sp. CY323]MCE6988021.1 DNA mismatch repair protein MutS [Dyadobacter sp. CY323]
MNIYQDRIEGYKQTISQSAKRLKELSFFRLIVFVFSIAIILVMASEKQLVIVLLVSTVCILVFSLLLKEYNKVDYSKKDAEFLREINENELLKQQNKLAGFPTGQDFIERDHAYVSDLDIFGTHALFQQINRATTESGEALLAEWLSEPATKTVILERQKSIQELAPKLDWRQAFQASGMHSKNAKSNYNKLISWIEEPVVLLPESTKNLSISILLAILSTSAAVYFVYGLIVLLDAFSIKYIIPLVITLFINSRFLKRLQPIAEQIIESTQHNIQTLGGYESLIITIESETFQSNILKEQQSVFSKNAYSASGEIKKLKRILEIFQQKGTKRTVGSNAFYSIFNSLWIFDVYLIILTEKWKSKNGLLVRQWASAVSEFEVLSSLAGFTYSNPAFTFPEILDEPYTIEFESLGHPLIASGKRITNDFKLNGRGHIAMITGSNMAGKSTFLRTIGMNLVLALTGAPCCAKSGRVSQMKVFTSMRTQDNLEEGVSSFYAELKKIEQLLKLIESGEAIFFLLDEMFKGTNSQDRYKGGVSLIKQLSELNAFGIISTHDLELAKLAGNHMIVDNLSFNSEIRGEEMIFNYKLTQGICKDFNASELMRKSGIKILTDMDV